MSSSQQPKEIALIRYCVPDRTISPSQRDLFESPAYDSTISLYLPLHDARTSSTLKKGAEGLDVHGFAYLKHETTVTNWSEVTEEYLREVEELLCRVTGAGKAVACSYELRRAVESSGERCQKSVKEGAGLVVGMAEMSRDRFSGT